jgi:PAS domain S-box-containing protein
VKVTAFDEVIYWEVMMHAKPTYEALESLVESSPDLIFRLDSKLRHLYVNQAILDVTGLSREQYLGKTNRDLGMPEYLCDLWDDVFLRVFETGQSQQTEFAYTGPQGRRYYQMRIVPEFDPHGVCKTAVGITRDMTEQKRAEQEIVDLAKFPSENPNPVFRVAKDGRVLYANEAALPMLGARDGETMPCVPDRWRQFASDSLASGKCMFREIEFEDRVFSVTFAPVLDQGYVNGYGLDVTDLKAAHARLAGQAAILETEVKERTKELNCLLSISELANRHGGSLDDILGKIPDLLVSSWQHPEIASARILLDDKEFKTAGFQTGDWQQSAAIHVHGKKTGTVEVCYLEERSYCDKGPFLKEERRLLDAVAERTGRIVEQFQADEKIKQQWEQVMSILSNFADSIYVADPKTYEILYANKALQEVLGKNPVGRLCYEALQGLDSPCHFCTNEIILKERRPYVWEYDNPWVEKSFLITDQIIRWPDGRDVRLEVAADITERKVKEDAIRESERRIRALSRRLAEAQEIERKRISQDLHDSIGSKLSAVKYGVEKALKQWKPDTPEEGISLQDVVEVVQDVIEETRQMSAGLSPLALDDLGILKTIEISCRKFERLYPQVRINPESHVGEDEVPEGLKIVIYRVIQEAIANAVKHSGARQVNVGLQKNKNKIELVVRDDGKGLDIVDKHDTDNYVSGMGLINMRERTELSGGFFQITSVKGKGTTLRAVWPPL